MREGGGGDEPEEPEEPEGPGGVAEGSHGYLRRGVAFSVFMEGVCGR